MALLPFLDSVNVVEKAGIYIQLDATQVNVTVRWCLRLVKMFIQHRYNQMTEPRKRIHVLKWILALHASIFQIKVNSDKGSISFTLFFIYQ